MVNVLLGYGSCIHTQDQGRSVLRPSVSQPPECAGRLPNGPALQTQLPHPLIIIYRDNPAHPIYGTSELPCHKEILDEFDSFFCEVKNERNLVLI